MSGCERGRRTRCEQGTEIHPTNRATTTPTSTSSTNQHQQNHQHPTQRPAPSTIVSSRAAVPPPAPAPHAGICSVHVSMYAQDSKTYSYVLRNKKCWHAGSCIYTCLKCFPLFDTQHTNKHAYTSKSRECKHLRIGSGKGTKCCAQHYYDI